MDGPVLRADKARPEHLCRWLAALLIIGSTLLRLVYLACNCPLDLAPDEAHYWDWSRHLDWSYYSKGPGVAWLIRLSCELFGELSVKLTGNEMVAVRLPAVVCGSLLLTSLYVLTVQVSGRERVALLVVAVALTTPTLSAGSSLMTIDSPYSCCWGWALVFGHRAIFGGSWAAWWAAGLLVGLGILFKYTMVLWLPSLGLFLLFTPEYRRWLWSRGLWILTALAGLSAVPIIVWNANHDWVTFHHVSGLAGLRQEEPHIHWLGPLQLVAVQCGLWLVFWFIVWVRGMLAHAPWHATAPSMRYLWWMSAPMFAVFFVFGFKTGGGEANWPVAAYISGIVLGILWLVEDLRAATGWYRQLALGGMAAACATGILVTLFVHGSAWIDPLLVPLAGPVTVDQPFPLRRLDPTLRLRGWRTMAAEVDRLRAELRAQNIEPVLAGPGWTTPGLIGFYCQGHPTAYSLGPAFGERQSQYDFWRPNPVSDAQQFIGRTFVIVTPAAFKVHGVFERVETYPVVYTENGQPVAGWVVMVCHGYRGFGSQTGPAKKRSY
jgi:4-amino-4-deoxy-L-arabinose transferase-like glycosyltransferase